MATPNYGYEKRQRELAKKKKKEEKLRAKTDRKLNPGEEQASGDSETDTAEVPSTAPMEPTKSA